METQALVPESDEALIQAVNDAYSASAGTGADSTYSQRVAQAFGYTPEELQSIPVESNMGLSCGNPVAAASIRKGEKILDLGSGGGLDVFLAASKVGPTGQAIGLDMSYEMIKRARENAKRGKLRPPHVAFVQALLTEPLPIASDSIDCVLSNCVINLLPPSGKASLLKEVYRVLKPGGRVFLDDIVAKQELPDAIRKDLASYVGCISGAIGISEYKDLVQAAGLEDVIFADTRGDINIYYQEQGSSHSSSACCDSRGRSKPTPDFDANAWVGKSASYQIYALKPKSAAADVKSTEVTAPLLRWWDAYPAVQSKSISSITNEEVSELIRNGSKSDFAVIDVRRNDHAGGHVRGSSQWPAQTFYDDLPPFYEQFKDVKKVVFYCNSCSPKARGPRSAGWYQDYLDAEGNTKSKAYFMEGGIKGWLQKYGGLEDLVDKDPE